jgi:hypothetical protein
MDPFLRNTEMAEFKSSSTDAHVIRTNPEDYARSDTGSEGKAQYEEQSEDEAQHVSVSTRLEQNEEYMDRQVTSHLGVNFFWVLEPKAWKTTEGSDVVLIRHFTASKLSY